MTLQRFQLIFEGKFLDGIPAEVGRKNLLRLFKGNTAAVDRLFSRPSVVVKDDLDSRTALRWATAFKHAGAACRLVPQPSTPAPDAAPAAKPADPPETNAPAQMTCPKCGLTQPETSDCRRCGIVVAKYRQAVEGRPEAQVVVYTADDEAAHRMMTLKNIATIAMAASLALLLIAFFMKDRFPPEDQINKQLYRWPYQTQTRAVDFTVRVGGQRYHVTPLYDYQLYGLVVSHYDATGWWDVTHRFLWKDFINIKDICVVYGENVANGVYREMSFKSGSWTCWPKPKTARAQSLFYGPCLSNNHLLSDKRTINRQIMRAEPGDQIYLRGYLATYTYAKGGFRGTSINRTDEGNGACETIWVTDFKILKKSNRFWRALFTVATILVTLSLVGLITVYWMDGRRRRSLPAETGDSTQADGGRWSGGLSATLHHNRKIILQLVLLLVLLLMWARLH